jgi:hypothetical protein
MQMNMAKLEAQQEKYDELDGQVQDLRKKYKWWKDLFADPEAQAKILADIERRANAIKTQIERLDFKPQPSLRNLIKTDGRENVADDLELLVIWLDAQLNKKESINDMQRQTITETILSDYASLRLEDVAVCFKNGIKGFYGKTFSGLDVQVVMTWLEAYKKELTKSRMERQDRIHISLRGSQHDHKNKKTR